MTALFWASIAVIVYSYFIYPLILFIFSGIKQASSDTKYLWRRHQRRTLDNQSLPPVSIIIAAYNEETCIKARVENLLALDYPQDKLTFLIGSDGSSDATAEILTAFAVENLQVHIFNENRGKMSVLNDLVNLAQDDILIFSDANTHFQTDTISKLTRHFDNHKIGAVCGELHLVDSDSGDNKDNVYWRYEQVLKFHESRLNALQGANGAIYAIRKALFMPLPANTIVDDFQIAMNVAKQGLTLRYDPEAIAIEEIAPNLAEEEGRRVRIGLGNYQAFFNMPWALNPLLGWRFIAYISHKVCRWFVPHFMLLAFVANCFLLDTGFYQLTLMAQLFFYALAFYGIKRQSAGKKSATFIALLAFFVAMNLALMRGFIKYFSSNVQGTWQRTTR
ncbi:Glycosyltransferase, catalytic subunit of cellulose synthase and poly-beta-1,6-N-acetylglucosamine synthase [Colwellia chukchiensis]|uniref:Glycosyltransferase, catalytic subunit of cellulose synthase and poly-beta-1,6-N-acetylglucosamine synthase n=1 Tax=Colwellia chukchiensis TaxID=641665 RepID=A0A1H7SDH5_9GAMM|nr:glycosyltransferase family 2 protein [Colwellia chukchiensis]SEL70523.1 Glycosyltransferase, catalytic subunit of cellulose synthase and poly-beta-1,6-N-acetylglucosamine synthase [Colwellia chukchiensis]